VCPLKLTPEVLTLDGVEVDRKVRGFIADYVKSSGVKGIVVGLSGGVDSSTTAALAARAIGGHRVVGLMLPEKETLKTKDISHAELVAKMFKLKPTRIDITDPLETLYKSMPVFDPSDKLSKGNVKARTRMIYIYYYANRLNMIVCGSSDKSETMMGYFTKWGDVAADISPIMDLYKTQVRELAKHIGVPMEIVRKAATPALWPGQLAEDELGMKYDKLDLILYGLEHFMKPSEIADQLHIEKEAVDRIRHRWLSAEHKRRMLLTAKLEYRTIGADFRLQRNPL
jgi:NAD+ synthase